MITHVLILNYIDAKNCDVAPFMAQGHTVGPFIHKCFRKHHGAVYRMMLLGPNVLLASPGCG